MHLSLVILASEREEFFLLGKLLSCSLTFYPFSSRLSSEWRSLGKLAPLLLSQRFPLSSPYIHLDADILPRGFFSPLNVHPFRPRAGVILLLLFLLAHLDFFSFGSTRPRLPLLAFRSFSLLPNFVFRRARRFSPSCLSFLRSSSTSLAPFSPLPPPILPSIHPSIHPGCVFF